MGRWGRPRQQASSSSSANGGSAAVEAAPDRAPRAPRPAPRVIPFYSDRPGKKFREFSNFYRDAPAFEFALPAFARCEGLPHSVVCEFSEKAIMLTKAALMGDAESFRMIAAARFPDACKKLGRGVRGFDNARWLAHLEAVAFEVVRQKFEADPALAKVLLSTGDAILVEAAPNDCIWGVGLSTEDDRVYHPEQWLGRNVLGQALMLARSSLRGELADKDRPRPGASSRGGEQPEEKRARAAEEASGASEEVRAAAAAAIEIPQALEPESGEYFLRPISDLDAVRACFEQYGVVAVTGCLSPEECTGVVHEGLEACLPTGCRMDDSSTFGLADAAMNRYGVVGKAALFNPALLAARLHPNVVAAHAAVHGTSEVFACHDRFAWMRPSALDACWDTPFSWPGLHLDISPRSYFGKSRQPVDDFLSKVDYSVGNFVGENNAKHVSMGRVVQGVLNLLDNDEEDGGFQCVPGMFGEALHDWVSRHTGLPEAEANGTYELKSFGPDKALGQRAVRVPCPAGTLILFDGTLPHGTKPNASARSRAILFLRYMTAGQLPAEAWRHRNAALRRRASEVGFRPDERQAKHLYGPE